MTHRARVQEGLDLRRGGISISPSGAEHDATRDLLDHADTRYNTRAWGDALTGRFCSVHHWPVFNCPPRFPPGEGPAAHPRQNDFHEMRLTSGAQRGLALSRPEPHVLFGTHERGGQPWTSLASRCSSVSMFTRTRSRWRTPRTIAARVPARRGPPPEGHDGEGTAGEHHSLSVPFDRDGGGAPRISPPGRPFVFY